MGGYRFVPMTRDFAEEICRWEYEPPYDFYNFQEDEEMIGEFLSGEFYAVLTESGRVAGFFCSGEAARVPGGVAAGVYQNKKRLDIGLGMNPALTGKGLGKRFVAEGLHYLSILTNPSGFRLSVAGFNERAIQVYKRNGFKERRRFVSKVGGKDVEFILMVT